MAAFKLVDQSCKILVEPADEKTLMHMLREARKAMEINPAEVNGATRSYDIAIYDIKTSGEVVTHPHLRIMSFRNEHYAKLSKGCARSWLPPDNDSLDKDNFPDNLMLCVFDGGKHQGNYH